MLIEVALVSEQTLANLLPALHERPDRVLLVASDEMAKRGLHVRQRRVLEHFGIEAQIVAGAPDADLARIHDFALELLGRLQAEHPGVSLVLNATGGNKLMMLGFVEVFRGEARIVYADTQHGRIEVLPAGGSKPQAEPMRNVLDVPGYLQAQGFAYSGARSDRAEELQAADARKPAAKHLGTKAQALGSFIGALNGLAAKALDPSGKQLITPAQAFGSVHSADWREALKVLNRCGALKWYGEEDIEFPDAEAARFCGGGWLEEYVWHIVRDARPHDARWSVRGHWEGGADNEFDVLAVHGNRMLFVECKTLRFGADEASGAERLYKLDSLGLRARGLFGVTWLVSARAPTEAMIQRAREQRIRIFGPTELPQLRQRVLDWMSGGV